MTGYGGVGLTVNVQICDESPQPRLGLISKSGHQLLHNFGMYNYTKFNKQSINFIIIAQNDSVTSQLSHCLTVGVIQY